MTRAQIQAKRRRILRERKLAFKSFLGARSALTTAAVIYTAAVERLNRAEALRWP